MRLPNPIIVAWVASALAFALSFVGWAFITIKFENPPATQRLFLARAVRVRSRVDRALIYGGILYIVLKHLGLA